MSARKSLKKARASLRLPRPALRDSDYRQENTSLRDAARPLSAARDAKVLPNTLRRLAHHYRKPVSALNVKLKQEALHIDRTELAHSRRQRWAKSSTRRNRKTSHAASPNTGTSGAPEPHSQASRLSSSAVYSVRRRLPSRGRHLVTCRSSLCD